MNQIFHQKPKESRRRPVLIDERRNKPLNARTYQFSVAVRLNENREFSLPRRTECAPHRARLGCILGIGASRCLVQGASGSRPFLSAARKGNLIGQLENKKVLAVLGILCLVLGVDDISKHQRVRSLENSLEIRNELELAMQRAQEMDLAVMAETSIVETKAYDRDSAAGFYDLMTIGERQKTLKLHIQTEFNRGRKDDDRFYFTELKP
jgi:hypothetical protein